MSGYIRVKDERKGRRTTYKMKLLLQHIKTYKFYAIISILLVAIMVGSQLWQPRLLARVMESIILDDMDRVYSLGIQLLIIAGIGLVAGVLNTLTAAYVANGVGADLRERVFNKIQTFSLSNIEKFSTGNLVVRQTRDVEAVQGLAMMMLQSLANIPFMLIGGIVFGMIALPQLWWVMLLLIILVLIVNVLVMMPLSKKFEAIMNLVEKLNGLTKGNLLGIKVVKSFVQEEEEGKRFTEISDVLTKYNISVGRAFAIMIPAYTIIVNMAVLVSLFLVGNMVSDDPAVIGGFASFMVYLGMIMMAIIMGGFLLVMASQAFVSLDRIKEVLDTEPDIVFNEGGSKEKLEGSVEFRDVSFAYKDEEENSLHHISFSAKSGEVIGIVGTTGSGKSTLVQLIPRLYDVSGGEIFIGGQNLKDISKEALRKSVSIVLQRPILFSGTIEENLLHGSVEANRNADASYKEMDRAAKIAQAYEFIQDKPELYGAEVEERGANYSGGQKQRLSLARGIIGKPSILILDDSTSALDARSEELVKKGISKELKGTTTFIVAQKISSVVHADKILVLSGGKLVGNGTHKELRETCPAYIEIYETQKGKGVA